MGLLNALTSGAAHTRLKTCSSKIHPRAEQELSIIKHVEKLHGPKK